MRHLRNFAALFLILVLTACSHDAGAFGRYYRPYGKKMKCPKTPLEQVKVRTCKDTGENAKEIAALGRKYGLIFMGSSAIEGELMDPSYARALGANIGGDYVILARAYLGKATGS